MRRLCFSPPDRKVSTRSLRFYFQNFHLERREKKAGGKLVDGEAENEFKDSPSCESLGGVRGNPMKKALSNLIPNQEVLRNKKFARIRREEKSGLFEARKRGKKRKSSGKRGNREAG